jgi:iron complex outermembrane recepter protein
MKAIVSALMILCVGMLTAQKGKISGTVKDDETGEGLLGAYVLHGSQKGTSTDMEGKFSLELEYGTYTLEVSYIGFQRQTRTIVLNAAEVKADFSLKVILLTEARVVADVAIERQTPVAFTNVLPAQIKEELASQDIPMILNSTPGVYATQQGGGDGDARVTIRGFDQRNLAVMIDGVPVNDMENGWVYWSNWFGLDAVTKTIQVQRGLGASKLAIPSVGGTMNILTQGIDAKKGIRIKQEVASFGFQRTTLGMTTGRMKNGWGVTAGLSQKTGNGFVDQTFTEGVFYYLKVEKEWGRHLTSISGFGAPQSHGQRSFKSPIAVFDKGLAAQAGVPDSLANLYTEYGWNYNQHWGVYSANQYISENDQVVGIEPNPELRLVRERVNFYHKPQFILRDFWTINDRMVLANTAYLSIGRGGGTGLNSRSGVTTNADGLINFQDIYDGNVLFEFGPGGLNLDEDGEIKSQPYLRAAMNNHFWYGYLSTLSFQLNENNNLSGGIDYRYYEGEHYQTLYDPIGGDYVIESSNRNRAADTKLYVGDKIRYHDVGIVRWAGAFTQWEGKSDLWSYFINVSAAQSWYKGVDYFRPKMLVLEDTTLYIGYLDVKEHNGITYDRNSEGLRTYETEWVRLFGYTVKGGANYNIDEFWNAFVNAGYLSRAPRFDNVIDINNNVFKEYPNENIIGLELGSSWANKEFAFNLNAYRTKWNDRPVNQRINVTPPSPDYEEAFAFVRSMDALHYGIELDGAWKVDKKLVLEGLVSWGDWTWQSEEEGQVIDQNGLFIPNPETGEPYTTSFDPRGVHVGNAAQFQLGASLRYEPIKNGYIKIRTTYFDKHYSDFSPETLTGVNAGRESWKVPGYNLLDIHAGYARKFDKIRADLRFSVFNALNTIYIADAQNNDRFAPYPMNDFDAASATVFLGMPRRFNISLELSF